MPAVWRCHSEIQYIVHSAMQNWCPLKFLPTFSQLSGSVNDTFTESFTCFHYLCIYFNLIHSYQERAEAWRKKWSLFLSAWALGFLQMSIPARKRPDSEVRAWYVCAKGHDITSVFDEPRATATAQYNQICHNFKCVAIYNLHLPHCEYVAVAALLCGHLSLTGMIQTAVINSIFVDSAASDSHDSTLHH